MAKDFSDANGRFHDSDTGMYVNIKEFFERILEEHDKAHAAQHEAVGIAAKELARRLEVLNHAHEQSIEDRSDFFTKAEAANNDQRFTALQEEVKSLQLNIIGRQHYETNRKYDIEHYENTAKALEQVTKDIAARVAETREADLDANEKSRQALYEKIDERFKPLERLASRAGLLFAGSAVFGGIIVYLITKAIG